MDILYSDQRSSFCSRLGDTELAKNVKHEEVLIQLLKEESYFHDIELDELELIEKEHSEIGKWIDYTAWDRTKDIIISVKAIAIHLGLATQQELDFLNIDLFREIELTNTDYGCMPCVDERLKLLHERVKLMVEPSPRTDHEPRLPDQEERVKDTKNRFSIAQGQISFDDKDLELPTGLAIDVAAKLISHYGAVVPYGDLDENSIAKEASEQLRKAKRTVVKLFKKHNIPCQIYAKRREGYVISDLPPATNEPQTIHKRVTTKLRTQ